MIRQKYFANLLDIKSYETENSRDHKAYVPQLKVYYLQCIEKQKCLLSKQKIYNISLRRLPSIRSGVTVFWIEDSDNSSSWLTNIQAAVANINTRILGYTRLSKCIKYLKQATSYEHVIAIFIVNNSANDNNEVSMLTNDLCRIREYSQIHSILVVSHMNIADGKDMTKMLKNSSNGFGQVLEVFSDCQSMSVRLQQLIDILQEVDDEVHKPFNQRVQSLRDVRQQLGGFIWSCSFKKCSINIIAKFKVTDCPMLFLTMLIFYAVAILMAMNHHSARAKQQMLTELRAHCRGNKRQLEIIDEFNHSYCASDAIFWYTKPCFFYRLVNSALRTGNPLDQYTFRYFLVDMCEYLEMAAAATRALYTTPFRVYRGAQLCRDEVEQLHIGTLVANNGFFSSSLHLDVAQQFIGIDLDTGMSPSHGRSDIRQYSLFKIEVDLAKFPDIIVADVSSESTVPDENEIIFDLGTTFIITDIFYDAEHRIWHIQMTLSSEVAQLHSDYTKYIRKRLTEIEPALLFGNVLADMLSDFKGALSYFHRLLRTLDKDDENRANVYFHLARVYRYVKKYQQAITYYRCAQLLQRRRLPQTNFDYARTLSGLGVIYLETGNPARAISLLQQGTIVKRRVLPEDHLEFAHIANRLAQAYCQEKQYEPAVALLLKTLSFFKRKMPTDHPCEAQSLHMMGVVQHEMGNREQALDYFQRALRIRENLLAKDDPVVGETCYELSVIHAERDEEYALALSFAQRALDIFQSKCSAKDSELQRVVQLIDRLTQKTTSISS
ncbi:unnamed protein product [Rotaria socialis]|uniref:NAD(P)(+)--arginine ADP-ribosyltransferase n=1 Tax=Rotaria socialis TaxID=392032 RepID=A0A818UYX3_9BILA|nr:unnamed protein product [Rotaria socialis]